MTPNLARQVQDAMECRRLLQQQRVAAMRMMERYGAAPTVYEWARSCYASDEPRAYHLLFRITDGRGASDLYGRPP